MKIYCDAFESVGLTQEKRLLTVRNSQLAFLRPRCHLLPIADLRGLGTLTLLVIFRKVGRDAAEEGMGFVSSLQRNHFPLDIPQDLLYEFSHGPSEKMCD
jgi:hypothetical protein